MARTPATDTSDRRQRFDEASQIPEPCHAAGTVPAVRFARPPWMAGDGDEGAVAPDRSRSCRSRSRGVTDPQGDCQSRQDGTGVFWSCVDLACYNEVWGIFVAGGPRKGTASGYGMGRGASAHASISHAEIALGPARRRGEGRAAATRSSGQLWTTVCSAFGMTIKRQMLQPEAAAREPCNRCGRCRRPVGQILVSWRQSLQELAGPGDSQTFRPDHPRRSDCPRGARCRTGRSNDRSESHPTQLRTPRPLDGSATMFLMCHGASRSGNAWRC